MKDIHLISKKKHDINRTTVRLFCCQPEGSLVCMHACVMCYCVLQGLQGKAGGKGAKGAVVSIDQGHYLVMFG